jgi:hypothetical protein
MERDRGARGGAVLARRRQVAWPCRCLAGRLSSPNLLDTNPVMEARYRERIGALSGPQRTEIAAQLTEGVRVLADAGLRHRYPQASREEIRCRLAALLHGRATAERLFGHVPEDAL